ncbi:hypothetical protein DASC09_063670 [Saccharomycopsis crataegensis]|uniref:Zn(2)-C6 fungal-type domain-containing protein n=1 Tax=Saccharomycopsis crataegensis TaxID=43959 RepID=A0AAV5QY60_9ASCO|nr:hypothetical protein DASC09_063670 [Saccharomycopsis crataegensis]
MMRSSPSSNDEGPETSYHIDESLRPGHRVSSACDSCRRRKTKCSGQNPCAYCAVHNLPCAYTYVRKKRTKYKKTTKIMDASALEVQIEVLTSRIGVLENQIYNLNTKFDSVTKMNELLLEKLSKTQDSTKNILPLIRSQSNTHNIHNNNRNHNYNHNHNHNHNPNHNQNNDNNNNNINKAPVTNRGYDPMKISQLVQRDSTIDKKTRKEIVDEFLDLISSSSSVTIFSQPSLKSIKRLSGKNFEIFEPVVKDHAKIIKKITRFLKIDFNQSSCHLTYLLERRQIICNLIQVFLDLNVDSMMFSGKKGGLSIIKGILEKWKSSSIATPPDLTNSEHLILCAIVCLGCSYMDLTITGNGNSSQSYSPMPASITQSILSSVNDPQLNIAELERVAMKDCFFYFHKLIKFNEGPSTIFGILLLCFYLRSTVFFRCNYLILSVACKHIKSLGYDKFSIASCSPDIDEDILVIKMLWFKCYIYDKDISFSVEKSPMMKDDELTDYDFFNFTKIIIAKFLQNRNKEMNEDYSALSQINFNQDNSIVNRRAFFNVLHKFATYSSFGFGLLVNYFSFTLVKLLSKYSKEFYRNSVLNNMEGYSDTSLANDEDFLGSFFRALDVVNQLNIELKAWEESLPENVRPNSGMDISLYKVLGDYHDENFDHENKRRKINNDQKKTESGRYLYPDSFSYRTELIRTNVAFLLMTQFTYYYHVMKANRLAHKACYLLYRRIDKHSSTTSEFEQKRIRHAFRSRMETFENSYLTAAKSILILSFSIFKYNPRVIYWGANFIFCAFFVIFLHSVGRFSIDDPIPCCVNTNENCLYELHLLIDCYLCCLSKPVFVIRHIDSNFVERSGRRMVLLCLENLKEKTTYNYDTDYKVAQFLSVIKAANEKDNAFPPSANTSVDGNNDYLHPSNGVSNASARDINAFDGGLNTQAFNNSSTIKDNSKSFLGGFDNVPMNGLNKDASSILFMDPSFSAPSKDFREHSVAPAFFSPNVQDGNNNDNKSANNFLVNETNGDVRYGGGCESDDRLTCDNIFLDLNDLDPFSMNGSLFHDDTQKFAASNF